MFERMSHEPGSNLPETATVENIRQAFTEWISDPAGGDSYVAKIGSVAAHLIENYEPFRNDVEFMVEARNDPEATFHIVKENKIGSPARKLTKQYAANIIRVAMQYNFLRFPNGKQFPRDFSNDETMREEVMQWYEESVEDYRDFTKADYFSINLVRRFIQTNYGNRGAGILIAKHALGDWFPESINAVDIGAASGEVWAQVMQMANFPFDINMLSQNPSSGVLMPDQVLSQRLQRLSSNPIDVASYLGVDLTNPLDAENSNWIWSGRRPLELVDKELINKDYSLTTYAAQHMPFHIGDFTLRTELDEIKEKALTKNGKYNVVTIFTAFYECSDEQIEIMLEHAAELLEEDGIILIQDLVNLNTAAPNGMSFGDDFRIPGAYKLVALWPHMPERGIKTIATYDTARCKNAFLNPEFTFNG